MKEDETTRLIGDITPRFFSCFRKMEYIKNSNFIGTESYNIEIIITTVTIK